MQKSFVADNGKEIINRGQKAQYYVKDDHPSIITPEVFDLVRHEFKKRKA